MDLWTEAADGDVEQAVINIRARLDDAMSLRAADGRCLLHVAAERGSLALARACMSQYRVATRDGLLPEDIAAQRGHDDVLELLLQTMLVQRRAKAQARHECLTVLERMSA